MAKPRKVGKSKVKFTKVELELLDEAVGEHFGGEDVEFADAESKAAYESMSEKLAELLIAASKE
ncbi:hypothetical protein [Streptomyces sp. NPDC006477]|uniref:hypothetical protein n=1 Tax=Streptomyces sp. NPDC006477 TaxID=3364747 RepID=UPI0036BB89A4